MQFGIKSSLRMLYSFVMPGLALFLLASGAALAQAPYALPYTMTTLVGPHALYTGVFPQPCSAGLPNGPKAYTQFGDGCPASMVNVGTEPHDVRVDGLGNVYWLDDSSSTSVVVRKYNPKTGLVTVYAGSSSTTSPVCSGADKYGDGCIASDNLGNVVTDTTGTYAGYTAQMAGRGLGLSHNGDLYIAGYNVDLIWKVSYSTHVMSVVAGLAKSATYVDNVLATSGTENGARGVGIDTSGDVFIADTGNNAVREVTQSTGYISTVGGSGSVSGSANPTGYVNGPESTSRFYGPEDAQTDSNGNVYVADMSNDSVRVLYNGTGTLPNVTNPVTGNWYTIQGNGTTTGATYAGIPIPALTLAVSTRKLSLDKYNNVYLADSGNDVVWFLDHVTGYMRVLAGYKSHTTGGPGCASPISNINDPGNTVGDGCPASGDATLYPTSDMGVSADQFGNIFITDYEGASASNPTSRIREVINGQNFGTVNVGSSTQQTMMIHVNPVIGSGAADTLTLTAPANADFTIVSSVVLSTTLSTPTPSNVDNTNDYLVTIQFAPTRPGLDTAVLTATTGSGLTSTFAITGTGNAAAVAIDPGAISALPAASSAFSAPAGVFTDTAGDAWIADSGSNRVFFYNANTNATTVIAGTGTAGYTGDNAKATLATLKAPTAVTADAAGNVYIADTGNNAIRRIDSVTGFITTYAGGSGSACALAIDTAGDGCPAGKAILTAPAGLAIDATGNLYVSDQTAGGNTIRVINTYGYISNTAGSSSVCSAATDTFGDGCPANAITLNSPAGLAVDNASNLYIADKGNNVIRKMNLGTTLVTLVAGNGQAGSSVASGSVASLSQLNAPQAVSLDAAGNVYIADTGNAAIRLVTAGTGLISTIVGINGASGAGTVPGSALLAQLSSPAGVSATGIGTLVVADSGNARVLSDNRTSVAYNFGRTNVGSSSTTIPFTEIGTGNSATGATLASPLFTTTSTSGFPNYFTLTPSSTSGCGVGTVLTAGVTCGLVAQFSPATAHLAAVSANYLETTNAVGTQPNVTLSGIALILTSTTATITQTVPANNASPEYGGSLVLSTTIVPGVCNPALTTCSPTGIPSGTVTFVVDGTSLAAVTLANATASQSLPGLSVGSHTVSVSYSGDLYYASYSTSATTITVTTAPTSTLLSLSPSTSQQFTTVTFTATVLSATTGVPTGNVTFSSNGTILGSSSLNSAGVATFTESLLLSEDGTTSLPEYANNTQVPGSYNVVASYGGDANFSTSASAASTQTITADTPAIQLTSKGCNSQAQVWGSQGVGYAITPETACLNDPGTPSPIANSMAVSNTLGSGVATTAGGVAGGVISSYELCPLSLPCVKPGTPAALTLFKQQFANNFTVLVTFTEANSFTTGQTVIVSGVAGANGNILNIPYTVLSATSTTWTAVLNSYVGTGQGATVDATMFVRASNTLTGNITFSCTGLPANSNCTFNPTSLSTTPGTGVPAYIPVYVTFYTDMQPGTGGTSSLRSPSLGHHSSGYALALLLGWPITFLGLAGVIRFRSRNGFGRSLTMVALLCMAVGSSAFFTGCGLGGPGAYVLNPTPAGVYPVTVTATDGAVSQNIIINFAVFSPGIPGQE